MIILNQSINAIVQNCRIHINTYISFTQSFQFLHLLYLTYTQMSKSSKIIIINSKGQRYIYGVLLLNFGLFHFVIYSEYVDPITAAISIGIKNQNSNEMHIHKYFKQFNLFRLSEVNYGLVVLYFSYCNVVDMLCHCSGVQSKFIKLKII